MNSTDDELQDRQSDDAMRPAGIADQRVHASKQPIPPEVNELARVTVNAAYQVHKSLGPGPLEGVYEACLAYELKKRGSTVAQQVPVPIYYDGIRDLRLDLLIGEALIVEMKSVEAILPVHLAQALTYLKLRGRRLGLLINFNVPLIRDGIRRVVL